MNERMRTLTWKKCYEIVRDNPRHTLHRLQTLGKENGEYGYCALGAIAHYLHPDLNLRHFEDYGNTLFAGTVAPISVISLIEVGVANDMSSLGGSAKQRALAKIAEHLNKEELAEVRKS